MEEPATRKDVRRLDGRLDNLEGGFRGLARELVNTNHRMDRMEDRLKQEMRGLNARVLTALDSAVDRMETLWRESALIPKVLDEHGASLRDHEGRIRRLESPRGR